MKINLQQLRKIGIFASILMAALHLGGCGQTGPLYLPGENPPHKNQ